MHQPSRDNSCVDLVELDRIIQWLYENFYEIIYDQRAFDIYIPPRCEAFSQSATPGMMQRLQELIASEAILSMLVLGDPGLGKTLLSYSLADLYWKKWKTLDIHLPEHATDQIGENPEEASDTIIRGVPPKAPLYLPVWLYLPSIPAADRASNLLPSCWKQQGLPQQKIELLQTACQQQQITLLVIIDGFDEIQIPTDNFYLSNGWFQNAWPQVKVITFSRPEAFSTLNMPIDYQRLFYTDARSSLTVADSFKELYLQPFSKEDIDQYLEAFVVNQTPQQAEEKANLNYQNWQTYKQTLQRITPLAKLAKNPFVLSILVQSLPHIVQEAEAQTGYVYTRERVYRVFVQDWLERQARRIWWDNPAQQKILLDMGLRIEGEQAESIPPKPPIALTECLWTYSENLARFALHEGKGKLDTLLNEEQTLRYELMHRSDRRTYFLEDRLLADEALSKTVLEIIRSGCLLKCQGQVYRFLHKTIVEFFAARALFNGAHIAAEYYLQQFDIPLIVRNFQLNEYSLLEIPQIIDMLADIANVEPRFKELLYSIIELSKEESLIKRAASNAITILNVAGEVFNDKDFKCIQIPDANLTGSICDRTDFMGADLSGVCFEHAWLRGAKFNGANLENAKFGELPAIKQDIFFTSMTIDVVDKILFTGDWAGYITQWNLITGEKLFSWRAATCGIKSKCARMAGIMLRISPLTLSPSRQRLAYATCEAIYVSTRNGSKQYIVLTANEAFYNDIMPGLHFLPHDENKIIFNAAYFLQDHDRGHLSLWDVESGKWIKNFTTQGCSDYALSPNGKYLGYLQRNKLIFYFFKNEKSVLFDHIEGEISDFSFSPRNTWLVVRQDKYNYNKKMLIFYEVSSRQPVKFFESNDIAVISSSLAFTADEKIMICEGISGISVWHTESGKHLYNIPYGEKVLKNSYPQSPIIVFLPTESSLSRIYCVRDTVIYSFEIGIIGKSIERKPHNILLDKNLHQGFLIKMERFKESSFYEINEFSVQYEKTTNKKKYGLPNSGYLAKLVIFKNEQNYCSFDFVHGEGEPHILLSPNKRYLIFTGWLEPCVEDYQFYMIRGAGSIMTWALSALGDSKVRLFDLQDKQYVTTVKHSSPITSMLFSSDSQWLITAGWSSVRIWEMGNSQCLQQYNESYPEAIALSPDKTWLVIVDNCRNLSLWDTNAHTQVFRLIGLMRRVYKLFFSEDGQFLFCNSEDKHTLAYQMRFGRDRLPFLQLVERYAQESIYCQNAEINDCILPNSTAITLFAQKRAQGYPISIKDKNKNKTSIRLLENALYYEKPIINVSEREYRSLIYNRLPLTYNNWVVSLLRDTQSAYPDHTFLIVEGVNAWGRFQLYRYEIAIKVDNKPVEKGFAAVVAQAFSSLSCENYQAALLCILLKADPKAGRGLESIVGHAWSLSRLKCLALHQAILSEKTSGLIPYSALGDNSLFSWGKDNCYTWCRKHLLTLRDPHITKNLPSRVADYVGVYPKFHLTMPVQPVANRYHTHCPVM